MVQNFELPHEQGGGDSNRLYLDAADRLPGKTPQSMDATQVSRALDHLHGQSDLPPDATVKAGVEKVEKTILAGNFHAFEALVNGKDLGDQQTKNQIMQSVAKDFNKMKVGVDATWGPIQGEEPNKQPGFEFDVTYQKSDSELLNPSVNNSNLLQPKVPDSTFVRTLLFRSAPISNAEQFPGTSLPGGSTYVEATNPDNEKPYTEMQIWRDVKSCFQTGLEKILRQG